jgi:peroxiredoxin
MDRRRSVFRAVRLSLFAAALVAGVACDKASADIAVGQPAPPFSLQDLDGKTVSLADFKGKTVVLEWINPNCPFSRGHSEKKTMATTAAKHSEAVWLGINSTAAGHPDFLNPERHKKFNAENGVDYAVLYDTSGAIGHAYGAKTTPHMFVIDKNGNVAYNGAIDAGAMSGGNGDNYVDKALAAIAAGKTPDPASTKPYGCSVKY